MKELSIEEKAKRYDEALERAKEMIKDMTNIGGVAKVDDIQYLFPELKESEDERIRKELLKAFQEAEDSLYMVLTPHKRESFISWLEKQDEQNPKGKTALEAAKEEKVDNANKVELKFKVGDWICNDYSVCHIASIENDMYYFDEGDGLSIFFVDANYHLWTIQDAKDGDVLATNSWLYIFKYTNNKALIQFHCDCPINGEPHKYCFLSSDSYLDIYIDANIHPATKEQRDLLFQKMHDKGYEWDAEKKEVKKISTRETEHTPIFKIGDVLKRKGKNYTFRVDRIQGGYYHCDRNYGAYFPIEDQDNWELIEQNPEWTPMDEQRVENLLSIIEGHGYPGEVAWLNSLKYRVLPQQEWSEDDKNMLQSIFDE